MKTIIYGNGAMAKVLYSYMKRDYEIASFTVDDHCIENKCFCNLPLTPFSQIEKVYDPKHYNMILSIGYTDMNHLREIKYHEALDKGYNLISYIDRSVLIHDNVLIEDNCIIYDSVAIHPGSQIKKGTFISSNVSIGHDTIINEFNWINSGVSIAGGCKIGKSCFLGVNSSLANDIKLGNSNYISANTLINKDTKDNEVYLSEPGMLLKLSSQNFLKFLNKENESNDSSFQ